MLHDATLFMCPPRFYGVDYVINPWMEGNLGRARRAVAVRQWQGFHDALAARATVELIDPVPGLPDMTFIANAGVVFDDVFIPARFHVAERQPEVRWFTQWFRQHDYRIVELAGNGRFEGEGDALVHPGGEFLWGGYGVRTGLQVYAALSEILDVETVPLHLVDPRFYHLDTCFCPLPNGEVIYYPDAFDPTSIVAVEAQVPAAARYAVSACDALHFACNAVVVGNTFITTFASDALRARLEAWGYTVLICPLSEFILAGGAAKCLALKRTPRLPAARRGRTSPHRGVRERRVEIRGHLLDRALMSRVLDCVDDAGGSFEIETFEPGWRHDQASLARLSIAAPSLARLDTILVQLAPVGARTIDEEGDACLHAVTRSGVAPDGFYSTTIFPTDVRIAGRWRRATQQRMDAVLVVEVAADPPRTTCRLLRDLRRGELVVCGDCGVRIHPAPAVASGARDPFGFMGAAVSSERRVELAVARLADEMRRIRERRGRIVVVTGPVAIHTGGGPHLASLIRGGFVQALLSGNGFAAHDIEQSLYGTSLGIDLANGTPVPGGHQHHLRAINLVRSCGDIANAVRVGALRGGVFYECVTHQVPFVLAGSIRDDGPLPDTLMDLLAAQKAYAHLLDGADMVLLLASMLHAIGVGNMTPASVRLVCVDINPAVATKLADRGSLESSAIITDVGLFLSLLDATLALTPHATEEVEAGALQWLDCPHP